MKSHLAKLSLALLSTAFLLGCQDMGSNPVGPEGLGPEFAAKKCVLDNTAKGCKDPKEGGQGFLPAGLAMTSGMTTPIASPELVEFADGENILNFSSLGGQSIKFAMALSATRTAAMASPSSGVIFNKSICVPRKGKKVAPTNIELNTLFNKLTDASQARNFFVQIDKNALDDALNEHRITVVWEDGGRSFNVTVGRLQTQPGESTVTVDPDPELLSVTQDVTVTFTGGSIRLRDKTGRVQEHFNLTCPNLDMITMVLSLPAPS